MPDPTLLDVARKVHARVRRIRPTDDAEELFEIVLSSYREALKAWPWGFALQRYRTLLPAATPAVVTLTGGSSIVTLVSGSADWTLQPVILIKGRRPLYTDGGGNLVDVWLDTTGDYNVTIGYSIIPLFDARVWAVAVTNVGPLQKMSSSALETLDPNREKRGRPMAFVPYTPYVEIYPVPDAKYDVDIWLTPLPEMKVDPDMLLASPLVDAVVFKSLEHLVAQSVPQLTPYYHSLYVEALRAAQESDSIAFSWPEFHAVYEAGTVAMRKPTLDVVIRTP